MAPAAAKPGIHVDVTIGIQNMRAALELFSTEELLDAIGQRQLFELGDVLKVGGKPTWKTMAPSTIAARPQRPSSHHFSSRYQTLLQQSGFSVVNASASQVQVGTRAKYVEHHHYGTGPYTIRPKRGRFLRFTGPGGGTIYARQVRHPGIPARPMLPTPEKAKELGLDVLAAVVEQLGTVTRNGGAR